MRAIILGGTGFIGKSLAQLMLGKGYEVVIPTRNPEKSEQAWLAGPNAGAPRFVFWDTSTPQGWGEYVDGARVVVNLVGESIAAGRWTPALKQRILDSRLNAGKAVVQAITQANSKPDVLVQASAIGFYGLRGNEKLTENDAPVPGSFLADTALAWEPSTYEVQSLGVRRVIIRTGVVLGRGGALEKMLPPFRFFLGGPMGSGKQWYSWIHLDDQVNAILHLIEHNELAGPFNLTAPNPVTMDAFAKSIGRALGRPSWLPVPGFALKPLGDMAKELILSGQRVLPKRLLETGYTFQYPEIDTALKEILS